MVTGKWQHTVGLNRINNYFMKNKTSTCLMIIERGRHKLVGGPGGELWLRILGTRPLKVGGSKDRAEQSRGASRRTSAKAWRLDVFRMFRSSEREGRRRMLDVLSGVKYQETQRMSHLLLEASHHDSDHFVCLGSLYPPHPPLPL